MRPLLRPSKPLYQAASACLPSDSSNPKACRCIRICESVIGILIRDISNFLPLRFGSRYEDFSGQVVPRFRRAVLLVVATESEATTESGSITESGKPLLNPKPQNFCGALAEGFSVAQRLTPYSSLATKIESLSKR